MVTDDVALLTGKIHEYLEKASTQNKAYELPALDLGKGPTQSMNDFSIEVEAISEARYSMCVLSQFAQTAEMTSLNTCPKASMFFHINWKRILRMVL
jgi:hypothetical protein